MTPEPTTVAASRSDQGLRREPLTKPHTGSRRWVLPMASRCSLSLMRSSDAMGRLVKFLMRFSRALNVCESRPLLQFRSFHGGRVRHTPMCRHRLPRPVRADFARGVVANGEHEIERDRAWNGEFIPALAAQTLVRKFSRSSNWSAMG